MCFLINIAYTANNILYNLYAKMAVISSIRNCDHVMKTFYSWSQVMTVSIHQITEDSPWGNKTILNTRLGQENHLLAKNETDSTKNMDVLTTSFHCIMYQNHQIIREGNFYLLCYSLAFDLGIWKSRKQKWNRNWKWKLEMEIGNGNGNKNTNHWYNLLCFGTRPAFLLLQSRS